MASYNYYWNGGQGFPVSSHSGGQVYPFPAGTPLQPSLNVAPSGLATHPQPTQPQLSQPTQLQPTQPQHSEEDFINLDLKVLNPSNKKDYHMYVLRHISSDLDEPNKLKSEIIEQCGESTPLARNMEIGYYHHTKKNWLNNRLDMNDMWSLIAKGEKVLIWCVGKEKSRTVNQPKNQHG